MSGVRVLVVDDSRTVRTLVCRSLERADFETTEATDGVQAIELVREVSPDLLILDIEMPVMNGYTLCQELQRMGQPYSSIPIIFLTSTRNHALELLGNQMGAYIQKPIVESVLLDAVHTITKSVTTN